MSIKRIFQTGMALLLVLSMLVSFAACNKDDTQTPTGTTENNETDSPDENSLAFPKTDLKSDFNILYPEWGLYADHFFATEEQAGETMADAILERSDLIFDYLGVDLYGMPTPTHGVQNIRAISIEVENKIASGDDAYQLVLTHTFESVTPMALGGYLLDFYEIDHINLDADYWNRGAVDSMAVGGVGYYALSDFMISDPVAVFFNKQMLEDYEELDNPYQLVRDGEWTLDKLFEMSAAVDFDNDGLADPLSGTYGFSAQADWTFISLIDSCNVSLLEDYGGVKLLNMSAGNQAYADLLTKVWTKMGEDWVHLYPYGAPAESKLTIDDDNVLFSMEPLRDAYKHREADVVFGILPTPTGTAGQEYRSFDWSGMMCVPNIVENTEVLGKTLEALSYFSQETTKIAYYEKLLGARLADAPEDKEMLDVIWDSIVLNPVINYMGNSGEDIGKLVYTIGRGVAGVLANGKPGYDIASHWNQYKSGAQKALDKFFAP